MGARHHLHHIYIGLCIIFTFVSPSKVIISERTSTEGFANDIEVRGLQTAVIAVLLSSEIFSCACSLSPFACEPSHLFGYFYPHGVLLYLDLALGPLHCSTDLVAHWTQRLSECIIVRGGSVLMVSIKLNKAQLIVETDFDNSGLFKISF